MEEVEEGGVEVEVETGAEAEWLEAEWLEEDELRTAIEGLASALALSEYTNERGNFTIVNDLDVSKPLTK